MYMIKKSLLLFLLMSLSLFAQVHYNISTITAPSVATQKSSNKSLYQKSSPSTITLGNYIWFDHNQNGQQDLGELGIWGVKVKLYDNANCTGEAVETTTSSDIGYYEFKDITLTTNRYCIGVVYPYYWTHTTPNIGNSELDSNLLDMNSNMGKIPNILISKSNMSLDVGLHHKDVNCQAPTLKVGEEGVYDNRNSWAKRASLDVEFKNVVASGFCHEYHNRGPERGESYSVHLKDRLNFTVEQRDRLSRTFRFMSDPDIVERVNSTFSNRDNQILFNLISNAFVWYYSDWSRDVSKVDDYIDNSWLSDKLSSSEKASLKDISHLILNRIEGTNGEEQYQPMKVYYLWNDSNDKHQDIIVPETSVVPKMAECIAPLTNGKIGDFVWFDADKNGKQDSSEVGLKNITVELYKDENRVATTKTDASGHYEFLNLPADSYVVKFIKPNGYSFTTKDAQSVSSQLNSDANSNGKTDTIVINESDVNIDIDAGLYITPKPAITVEKTTNDGKVANIVVGDAIKWSYKITNSGNTLLTNIVVTDDKEGAITTCSGDGSLDSLAPSKSIVCTKTGTAILGTYSNRVDVVAKDDSENNITATDSSSYVGKEAPVLLGSIGDYVWLDSNRDGIQNGDELPLSDIAVELFDENRTLISSTKTDSSGKYNFKDLSNGKYYLKFASPKAYRVTKKSEGSNRAIDSDADRNGKTALFRLATGEDKTDIDLGLYPKLANLGDRVWFDSNANGIQDANEKRGVADVTVKLYNDSNKFIKETKTTSTGAYLFRDLTPGDYYLIFEIPSNYRVSPKKQGSNRSSDSNANVTTGKTDTFTLFAGRDDKSIDMGLYQEATKVGDRVFYDTNKNGIQDNGESGVANVTVALYQVNGTEPLLTTKTSASGIYLFEDVAPGEYYIQFSAPAGYTITDAGKGTPENDSNPDKSGRTENFILVAGTQNSTIDMGIYQNVVSFGDRVFLDSNHNGLQDIGEKGVQGVKVTIFSANSNFSKTMLTDENGNYLFTHLPAGEYSAEFSDIPYGHLITQKDVNNNSNDLNDSDGFLKDEKIVTEVALLTPGTNDLSWDLGIYKTVCLPGKAVLGDLVWEDFNKNGIQDVGERGIKNVVVMLYNNDTDEKVAETVTDDNGLYEFAHIDPNFNYYVQFKVPAGYIVSPQDQDDDSIDSDTDATGKTDIITLESDKINSSVDMGLYHEGATLGDRVWFDELNGASNGIQDADEQGVFDVKVTLYNAQGEVVKTTRTNASGEYHFTNVEKGRYTIGFSELPTGYIFTSKEQGIDEERDSDVDVNGRTNIIVVNGTAILTSIDAGLKKVTTGVASNDIKKGVTGQNVTVDVLANDVVGSYNFDISTVKITSVPDGATLSADGKRLTVPNEGVWSVDSDSGAITFTPKDGFTGDPTPITYSVSDTQGNETTAEVEIDYPPLAKDDTINGEVGKQIVLFVLENDRATSSPLDRASLRLIDPTTGDEVETVTVQGEGVWSTNIDGSITFTPNNGFVNNPTPIQYVVKEEAGDISNRATITILYPDAVDDMVIIPAGYHGSTTVNVADNDSANTIPSTVTIGCEGAGVKNLVVNGEGSWSVDEQGVITFTPEDNFLGDPTDIQYTIGLTSTERSNCATVDLRHELLAVDDSGTLNVGGVSIINILGNDSGALNPSTVQLVIPNNPVEGTTLSDDGKILTVPNEGVWRVDNEGVVTFTAVDGFTTSPHPIGYSVEDSDGTRSNVATIILTEGGLSITANDDRGQANGGEPVVINVLANDEGDINSSSVRFIDANGDEVTTLVVPNEGTWTVNNNGVVTFTGDSGYVGTPTPVRYVVHGNSAVLSDTATVRIDGKCDCKAYESSIPSMGVVSTLIVTLLTILLSMLFLRKEEFYLVK